MTTVPPPLCLFTVFPLKLHQHVDWATVKSMSLAQQPLLTLKLFRAKAQFNYSEISHIERLGSLSFLSPHTPEAQAWNKSIEKIES